VSGHYRRTGDLRWREMQGAIVVYTPSRPALHWLNPAAWLIVELCGEGSELDALVERYAEAVPSQRGNASSAVTELLTSLNAKGIVQKVNQPKEVQYAG
jgi:Coenzyme PQQ synthesis protein D (PqqD)